MLLDEGDFHGKVCIINHKKQPNTTGALHKRDLNLFECWRDGRLYQAQRPDTHQNKITKEYKIKKKKICMGWRKSYEVINYARR